jgi:hypothetical protein
MPNREIMPDRQKMVIRRARSTADAALLCLGLFFGKTGPTPSQDWAVNAPGYSNPLALA